MLVRCSLDRNCNLFVGVMEFIGYLREKTPQSKRCHTISERDNVCCCSHQLIKATRFVFCGAGGRGVSEKKRTLTVTEPHLPLSLVGSECGSPKDVPQYPRRIGSTLNLAMMMAARIAVATSLDVLIPSPTCPSESPMTTMALKRVR